MFRKKGFTLIELVMIIVILGILAAVAIPRYRDLASEAKESAEKGIIGGVRGGIHTYYAKYRAWPDDLDDNAGAPTACSATTCFDKVLEYGVEEDWTKTGTDTYTGPNFPTSAKIYTYDNTDGSFK